MIKVKIGHSDIGILSLLYSRSQLPKGKSGEIFYDKNQKNEIENIYFKNEEYFKEILNLIKSLQNDFMNSNASQEYTSLTSKFIEFEEITDDLDYGYLTLYTPVLKNFEPREIDLSVIQNISSEDKAFYRDMKRLYKEYDVTYWGSPNNVAIKYDFDIEKKFELDLQPIIDLISAHKLKLNNLIVHYEPLISLSAIKINVE